MPFTFSLFLCAVLSASPSLRDVLDRAGRYALQYGESLATVIADEDYTQQLVSPAGEVTGTRVLRSEIAFVKLADSTEWQAFRDVLTVDGQPVSGAGGRLERILRDAPVSVLPQVRLLATESARYNLGSLRRDFNVPTTALQFVHPVHQNRFRFSREREEALGGERVWVVRFKEQSRGTLIRGTSGENVPVEGRLWIVPEDGRLVRSEFSAKVFRMEISTTWRLDDHLGLWVPAAMLERYADRNGGEIRGQATYSNYRKFDVRVRIVR